MVQVKNLNLDENIKNYAQEQCPDYPNIKTVDVWESFYVIKCALEGTQKANEDLHQLIYFLIQQLGWTKEQTYELWDENCQNFKRN